jgi:hypothetical protein
MRLARASLLLCAIAGTAHADAPLPKSDQFCEALPPTYLPIKAPSRGGDNRGPIKPLPDVDAAVNRYLAQRGDEGWELVTVLEQRYVAGDTRRFCFKRPRR